MKSEAEIAKLIADFQQNHLDIVNIIRNPDYSVPTTIVKTASNLIKSRVIRRELVKHLDNAPIGIEFPGIRTSLFLSGHDVSKMDKVTDAIAENRELIQSKGLSNKKISDQVKIIKTLKKLPQI